MMRTPTGANPDMAHWVRELRKSNAATRHVPTPRKGTRRAARRRAITDSLNQ